MINRNPITGEKIKPVPRRIIKLKRIKEVKKVKKKLESVASKFFVARAIRLEQKEKAGWDGWDDKKNKCYFEDRIKHDAFSNLTQKRLVDIANFCNFLWNLIEEKEGGKIK